MNKYLIYNILLIFAVITVVVSAVISGYFAFKDNKLFNLSAYNIQLVTDSNTSNISTDTSILISQNSEIISDDFDIFILNPAELIITKDLNLEVKTGIFFISTKNPITVNLGHGTIKLSSNVKGIYNSKDNYFSVISGQIYVMDQSDPVASGKYVVWGVDKFNSYNFDSNKYNNDTNLVGLINFLKEKESLPDDLKNLTRKKF